MSAMMNGLYIWGQNSVESTDQTYTNIRSPTLNLVGIRNDPFSNLIDPRNLGNYLFFIPHPSFPPE